MSAQPGRGGSKSGTLILVPNTLDLGCAALTDLQTVLPQSAIECAARLRHWVCENAKTTRAFLKRVDAVVPLAHALPSLDIRELPRAAKGAPPQRAAEPASAALLELLAPALAGFELGLISDAGLPAVADPGAALVAAAHAAGVGVRVLAGPNSMMLALAASGLDGQSFAFVGYVPRETDALTRRLVELESMSRRLRQTQLMIEAPYRNAALLRALTSALDPGTQLSVSCGLTLAGGWTQSDSVAAWRRRSTEMPADVPAVFALLAK